MLKYLTFAAIAGAALVVPLACGRSISQPDGATTPPDTGPSSDTNGLLTGDAGSMDAIGDGRVLHHLEASGDCGDLRDGAFVGELRMCCGGKVCKGYCIEPLDPDAGPACDCYGVWNGCPADFICCNYLMACFPPSNASCTF